jgi:hypothetical protein
LLKMRGRAGLLTLEQFKGPGPAIHGKTWGGLSVGYHVSPSQLVLAVLDGD